jgi:hypothetical protein
MLFVIVFFVVFVSVIAFAVVRGVKQGKAIAAGDGPAVIVATVKGNRAAERKIAFMLGKGYELQGQGSRKVAWSPVTGVFTSKQKHTLTFVKKTA